MLTEIISLLPVIGAASMVAFGLINRSIDVQARDARLLSDEARMTDLVRRIRHDTASADAARLDQTDTQCTLRLDGPLGGVSYEASTDGVRRVEHRDGEACPGPAWHFEQMRVTFALEEVAALRRIVWTTFSTATLAPHGPSRERQLSAAAAVGRGGAE